MRDMCGMSSSFPHLILLENGPKAVEIEEETWWRVYWSKEEVEKAKMRPERKQSDSRSVRFLYSCSS